jgi:outer membrane receptor protein involved in Fe transport
MLAMPRVGAWLLPPVTLLMLSGIALAAGPNASDDNPFALVREQQVVTGASKRPQPLSETPSSVTVITAADIEAQGFHTLADALRWARGLYVTYDRNYSYLGVRGLQRPGDYNNKVLLTLDGHAINGNLFGDAAFGPELGLDMEIVERIEIVRGPVSALYGSNAVLAVVNVVTRQPRSEPGLSATARAGSGDERRGFLALAWSRPGWPQWNLTGSYLDTRGFDLFFPEYAPPSGVSGEARGLDGERDANFFGTAEWMGARLAVKVNRRDKHIPTGSYGTTFGDSRTGTTDGHDFVELSGRRKPGERVELDGRAYWDALRYSGIYVYGAPGSTTLNHDLGYGDAFGTELRVNWSPGVRQVVTGGIEARWHPRRLQQNWDDGLSAFYTDKNVDGRENAAYLQDEIRLVRGLRITAGARIDDDSRFDPVFSPRLDAAWQQSLRTSWRLLAGTAYRAPSVYETDYAHGTQIGNMALLPERVRSMELSVVRTVGRVSGTLAVYHSRVLDLIDYESIDTLGTLQFRNREQVRSQGIEGDLDWVPAAGIRVRTDLAWQRSWDAISRACLTNSPRWNGHVLVSHAPAGGRLSTGVGIRALSPRRTLAGHRTASAIVTDARIGWRWSPGLSAAFEVRNLLGAQFGDPASREFVQDQIMQDGRALYLTLSFLPGAGR